MKKVLSRKRVLILLIVAMCAIGILVLIRQKENSASVSNSPDIMTKPLATERVDNALSSPVAGKYIDYSTDIIASTAGTKVLFFHAPWCPQCRALDKSIKEKGVPKGVTIIKVDYDISTELRKKYSVTLQTTIVRISDDGTEQKKFVAYDNPSIESIERELL